jgi:hypothetical protein
MTIRPYLFAHEEIYVLEYQLREALSKNEELKEELRKRDSKLVHHDKSLERINKRLKYMMDGDINRGQFGSGEALIRQVVHLLEIRDMLLGSEHHLRIQYILGHVQAQWQKKVETNWTILPLGQTIEFIKDVIHLANILSPVKGLT